ncbi:MAG: GNAT family N-acetyltransferase [Fuerstiella sp.]|nr:GNAT family N-acetyltransferase [Fuerstiella sp.]
MTDEFDIVHAQPDHTDDLAPLFDAYRCWHGMKSDPDGARRFIRQRITAGESEIFFVSQNNRSIAFTQLYPVFCSMSMDCVWMINDLYVIESARQKGLGSALLETAVEFVRALGANRILLEIKSNNTAAQTACETFGWNLNSELLHYSLNLSDSNN